MVCEVDGEIMKIKVEGMPVKKSPLKCSPSDILRKNLQIQRHNNAKEEAFFM